MPKSINLLKVVPQKDDTPLQKFFRWTISSGKSIIILIEIIVISLLVVKFGLERSLDQIRSEINKKKETIESFGDLEDSFVLYQSKLNAIGRILDNKNYYSEPLRKLTAPDYIEIKGITLKPENVKIEAETLGTRPFVDLITYLLDLENVKEIVLDSVSLRDNKSKRFLFGIRVITEGSFFDKQDGS